MADEQKPHIRPIEDLEGAPGVSGTEVIPNEKGVIPSEVQIVPTTEEDKDAEQLREFSIFGKSLASLATELVTGFEGDRKLRKPLAIYVCAVTGVWLLCGLALLSLAGFGKMNIPESVQLALLGSATLAIIGLLATVLTYYFTNRDLTRDFFTEILKQIRQK